MLVLHVVLHVCCMCVACALHEQGHTNHIPELGKWDKRGRGEFFLFPVFFNIHTQIQSTIIMGGRREILEAENLKSAITSESILCVQYVLMHLEMHNVSPCPRGQKGQEAEKQNKGVNAVLCFSESGRVFFCFQSFST